MGISETKKKIVIDNYFKNICNVNTSIKEAFTKGFEVGLTKAVFSKDQYEARLKADMVAIFDKIRTEIEEHAKINQNLNTDRAKALCWCLDVIDKYEQKVRDKC